MSERGGQGPRAGRRAAVLGGRRAAADWAGRAGDLVAAAGEWIAGSLRAEADAGRLAPWLAVSFGTGVLLYFAAPSEPSLFAPFILLALLAAVTWASRARPFAFSLSLALTAVAAGFTAGSLRSALVEHSVLTRPTGTVALTGFVEERDATERSERIVLRVTGAKGRNAAGIPERVRIAYRRGTAPKVGEHIETLARLSPLLGPVRPGGYDYARGAYFQGLGASGFALGRAKAAPAAAPVPLSIRASAAIDDLRRALTDRIRSLVPGEPGAIAAALVTGMRDAISVETNEAMRVSGLYHVLSISGLHMALVAGALFALIRGGLALVPPLALRRPIKKWAAVAALAGCGFYLVLSGAEVATQRSYIMIAIVLGGVLIDRPAITVRTLSAAAIGVLLLQPEALLNPSFQMSFAATLALVALYERYVSHLAVPPVPGSGVFAHVSERVLRWLLFGAAVSLFAGLATAAYVAFHFQRVAPYSVLANLLAMPLTSFVIMPMGLFSMLLLPFGYDAFGWKIMGAGIEGMLRIAHWVAALPGADGRFAAFGAGALLLGTFGFLLFMLPATRIRLAGVPLMAMAFLLAVTAPRPDVIVETDAKAVAARIADGEGRISILDARRARLAAENWLAADADGRKAGAELARGFACDASACTARLRDGALVAVVRKPEAFDGNCRDAALVVTGLSAPESCVAPVVDRGMLASTGAVSLRRVDGKWIAEAAREPYADRPWYARRRPADAQALSRLEGRRTPAAAPDRNANATTENPDDPPDATDAGDE
ncbi:MAG: ComEC family competence protein [Bradyrhizobiaceae bacterium]|nr:ComEC family competence protein [Bradyrhizobiaceae bacterium]